MAASEKSQSILEPESILEGPFWSERIKVISSKQIGAGILLRGIGIKSGQGFENILMESDLTKIRRIDLGRRDFSGDADSFFLSIEAKRIRFAYQFDHLYAVNVSQIDPLPTKLMGSILTFLSIQESDFSLPMTLGLAKPSWLG